MKEIEITLYKEHGIKPLVFVLEMGKLGMETRPRGVKSPHEYFQIFEILSKQEIFDLVYIKNRTRNNSI